MMFEVLEAIELFFSKTTTMSMRTNGLLFGQIWTKHFAL